MTDVLTVDQWNFTSSSSKDTVLRVLSKQADAFFDLVADPADWEAPTACAGWQVSDIVAHLVDAIEGYLPGWDATRTGAALPEPLGLRAMAATADANARALRTVPRTELLARLRDDVDQLSAEYDDLDADTWGSLLVTHPYMGPLPAMFYPMFQLVDFAVHAWDIRQGAGVPHALDGEAADLLVPLIYVLWQATADTSTVVSPLAVGVRVSGVNGAETCVQVTADGVTLSNGPVAELDATIEFDPASFVLTAYGRVNAGTVRGNQVLLTQFRKLFFPI